VIQILGGTTATPSHAIVALADTAGDNPNYPGAVSSTNSTFSPSTNEATGKITITGGGGSYVPGQAFGINNGSGLVTGNVGVTAWAPPTDKEIYGIDVKVGTSQASGAELGQLIAAIDGDGVAPASGVSAVGTLDPTGGTLSGLDTASTIYNLFLTFTSTPGTASDDLGIDLSSTNDSNLVGYDFTAVAVVPEPMSLSLLALGGVGLMARRNRRKS
jgi:hypothetical protein